MLAWPVRAPSPSTREQHSSRAGLQRAHRPSVAMRACFLHTIPYHTVAYRTVPYQSDQPTNTTPMDHAMSCQSEEMFRRAQPRARNSRSERLNVNAFRARRTVVKLNEDASAAGAGAPPAAVIIVIAIVIPHPCPVSYTHLTLPTKA